MMSAPSSARRTAWLRPWPRPAPVMKATLPSTLPGTRSGRRAGALPGDPVAWVAGSEDSVGLVPVGLDPGGAVLIMMGGP
jgi:hypothetical protein